MAKISKIQQEIEDKIMSLPDDHPTKIQYLEKKRRKFHITFCLPDGSLCSVWIYKGENSKDVIEKITNDWYKSNNIEKPIKEETKKSYGKCPLCGGDLYIQELKKGKVIVCSGFPKCKYVANFEK